MAAKDAAAQTPCVWHDPDLKCVDGEYRIVCKRCGYSRPASEGEVRSRKRRDKVGGTRRLTYDEARLKAQEMRKRTQHERTSMSAPAALVNRAVADALVKEREA